MMPLAITPKASGGSGGGGTGDVTEAELQAALATKVDVADVAAPDGVASLDASGQIPYSQLPGPAEIGTGLVVADDTLSVDETYVALKSDLTGGGGGSSSGGSMPRPWAYTAAVSSLPRIIAPTQTFDAFPDMMYWVVFEAGVSLTAASVTISVTSPAKAGGTGEIAIYSYDLNTQVATTRLATTGALATMANTAWQGEAQYSFVSSASLTAGAMYAAAIMFKGITTNPKIRCSGGASTLIIDLAPRLGGAKSIAEATLPASLDLKTLWNGSAAQVPWMLFRS